MIREQWQDIPNYDGKYQISNYGRVKSVTRMAWNGHSYREIPEKILKQRKWNGRYWQVKLSKNGKVNTFYVHRLVGQAFVEGYEKGLVINHKDNNGFNNYFGNLEWISQKDNVNHAWDIGACETVREAAKKQCLINFKIGSDNND